MQHSCCRQFRVRPWPGGPALESAAALIHQSLQDLPYRGSSSCYFARDASFDSCTFYRCSWWRYPVPLDCPCWGTLRDACHPDKQTMGVARHSQSKDTNPLCRYVPRQMNRPSKYCRLGSITGGSSRLGLERRLHLNLSRQPRMPVRVRPPLLRCVEQQPSCPRPAAPLGAFPGESSVDA